MREGEWFERACRAAVRLWPVNAERSGARQVRLGNRVRSLDAEIMAGEQRGDLGVGGVRERTDHARRLRRLRLERDRAGRILEQAAFHRALEFSQLRVTLEEVLRLATLAAAGVLFFGLALLIIAVAVGSPPTALLIAASAAAVGPLAAYAGVASYPEALAKRFRVESLGEAPGAVNYMAMSMRLVPALDRAVAFAAHHAEEPLASRLRHVLWSVYLRSPAGIEAAFHRFARDWGEWQEDLKRAFFAIGSAVLERTEAGLERALEKARQIAFEGTRTRIREYAVGLRGPTTVLFALGILLPLIIGAMLPLLSLGGLGSSLSFADRSPPGADLALPTVLAMDVLFPLGAFAYAYRILGQRPGTRTSSDSAMARPRRFAIAAAVLAIAAIPAFWIAATPLGMLAPLWILVAAALVYLVPGLRVLQKRRRWIADLEAEFPDALFILGSRISEGLPVERAMEMAAAATRGSEAAVLFEGIVRRLQTSRAGLEEVLFSPGGVLAEVPSRTVHAALRMVIEVSRKDPATAGKTVVETSAYLRDLRDVDREIRRDLSSVVEAMQSTGTLFAPLVLGVTCALYGLLVRSFSRLVTLGLSPSGFLAVVGVYLLLAVAVITYFSVGVARGRDPVEVRVQLVRTWPASLAVFTLAFLVAQAGLSI